MGLKLGVPSENVTYFKFFVKLTFGSQMLKKLSDHAESKNVVTFSTGSRFHLDTAHVQMGIDKFKPKRHGVRTAIAPKLQIP